MIEVSDDGMVFLPADIDTVPKNNKLRVLLHIKRELIKLKMELLHEESEDGEEES